MKLSIDEYYDDRTGEYIGSRYAINDEPCSEDDFNEMFEELNFSDYDDEDDDCDCVNCTIDRYVEMIYELADGQICPICLRDIMCDFFETMVDHIVIESIEDN